MTTTPNEMSNEELTKAIYEAMQVPHLSERHDAIKKLINTQKRLYTESVIDNALEDVASYQAMSNRATVTVNELMNPGSVLRAYIKDSAELREKVGQNE